MLLYKAKERFLRHLEGLERSQETLRGYRNILNYLEEYFAEKYNGPVYLDDIGFEDLDDFIYNMSMVRNWKPNSVQKCNYALRSFFGYCFRKKLYPEDISQHMEPVRGERKERIYLTELEFKALAKAIDHPIIKMIVVTMFYSGMRITECLNLKLEEVNFQEAVFHIRQAKGNVERKVPMHKKLIPRLKDYLDNYRPEVETDYFFATQKTGRVSAQYVNVKLKEATDKLSWSKHVTTHVLRHSFASNLIKINTNLVHVQKLLGHADLRTTSVYTHARLDELAVSLNSL